MNAAAIAHAYKSACRLDVSALKPGNVHVFAAGHGMEVADFLKSADVSAPFIADPGLVLGGRIRGAVETTFDAVGCNTNLGIVLLCAPLAMAAEQPGEAPLASRVATITETTTRDDARDVFRAIARASPAGLGRAELGDVHADPAPDMTLGRAMALAADRDLVARQYATGFALVFDRAAAFARAIAAGATAEAAMSMIFIQELARTPDTHIARKHGTEAAERVRAEAADLVAASRFDDEALMAFDARLKSASLNPGSLADVMVAAVFAAALTSATPNRA